MAPNFRIVCTQPASETSLVTSVILNSPHVWVRYIILMGFIRYVNVQGSTPYKNKVRLSFQTGSKDRKERFRRLQIGAGIPIFKAPNPGICLYFENWLNSLVNQLHRPYPPIIQRWL